MCKKSFWVKSLWVKHVLENRGRWDAGFRSPLLRYYNIIYIIIAVAYLQTNPCFNYKICGNCISGHQRVRFFAGYEAIFVLSIWSHLVSWPNLGCCLRSERVVLPCFAKPRLMLTDPGACPMDVEYAEGERHCTKLQPWSVV